VTDPSPGTGDSATAGNSDLTSTTGSVSGALNTEVHEIVWHDASTGTESTLVSYQQLTPAGSQNPLTVDDYTVTDDRSKVLIYTKSMKVWRLKTKGSYWILDLSASSSSAGSPESLRQLGVGLDHTAPNETAVDLKFATFSPDLQSVAYVFRNNLYMEDSRHNITQLTNDGSDMIINGTFDWVYEEEFGMYNGFRWSPDSKSIAYWQIDQTGVSVVNLVNNTDSLYPKLNPIPYPKCGDTNPSAKVGIVEIPESDCTEIPVTSWVKFEDNDSRNNYIADICFVKSQQGENFPIKQQLIIQRLNRLQNHLDIVSVECAEKGLVVSTIYTEDSDSWIDIGKPIKWVSLSTTHTVGNNNYFLLLSERNGWRQILLVGNNNGEADSELSSTRRFIEVTPVGFDVESICGFDDVSKVVYFIASPVDPLRRYLYSVSLSTLNTPDLTDDVQFPVQRVTPTDESFSGMCFTVIPLALYTALMLYHVILYIMS
jgi:dipeptidyl-peptidase-4